jgi:hypothetical protein
MAWSELKKSCRHEINDGMYGELFSLTLALSRWERENHFRPH